MNSEGSVLELVEENATDDEPYVEHIVCPECFPFALCGHDCSDEVEVVDVAEEDMCPMCRLVIEQSKPKLLFGIIVWTCPNGHTQIYKV